MKNVLIRDLDDSLIAAFKVEAKRRRTSLQAVLKQALNNNLPQPLSKEEILMELRTLRAKSGPSDGTTGLDLIAEGRREQDEKFARVFNW